MVEHDLTGWQRCVGDGLSGWKRWKRWVGDGLEGWKRMIEYGMRTR